MYNNLIYSQECTHRRAWNYKLCPTVPFFFFQERIAVLLGGTDKVDAHHVTSCVSYCKEKYTLWRADIRKKVHTVLNIINP